MQIIGFQFFSTRFGIELNFRLGKFRKFRQQTPRDLRKINYLLFLYIKNTIILV